MFRSVLIAILVPLITLLVGALIAVALRPRREPDDVMKQVVGDAPRIPPSHRVPWIAGKRR